MKIQRYIIILLAMLSALAGFCRPATDNKTFERFYNLSPKEIKNYVIKYKQHNQIDSAMICANILASKFNKGTNTVEEAEAYYYGFRFMGLEYLYNYCNYQLAAENILKAEQIAHKNELPQLQSLITVDKAILTATRNDLENNFQYNKDVIDNFKKASHSMLDQTKVNNSESNKINLEITLSNLMYLAIKFDKTKEVTKEVEVYREAQKRYGTCCNEAEEFCNAVENYNAGNYDKAFEALQTPINRPKFLSEQERIQAQVLAKMAQYSVLLKSGKRAEALNLLLQLEQSMRENGLIFEQLEALQLIWQHYETDGNKAMADKYALQYYMTKDEFINKSRVGKIDQAKLNLELEQTRERISEMSYRQRMQAIVLWSAIIIALLALALLGVLWVNYRKTKRTNRLLYEKNIALLSEGKELLPAATVSPAPTPTPAVPARASEKPTSGKPTQADHDLMEKVIEVMETTDEVYSEKFSLFRLAELIGTNPKYVSRAINTCGRRNFNVLLNEYRVKEACHRLMDAEKYGGYTIEAIANSVGFKSRSNFAAVFRDIVGITPSAFQKLTREGKTLNA